MYIQFLCLGWGYFLLHYSECETVNHLLHCIHCVSPCPVSLHPSLVNVHIQHPPEAEVQIHQVARVQPGQRPGLTEGAHSVQQRSQPGNGHEPTSEHSGRYSHANGNGNGNGNGHARPHNRQNGHVGRCFQETVDGQVLCSAVKAHCVDCHHYLIQTTWRDQNHRRRWNQWEKQLLYHRHHYIHILSPPLSQTGSWPVGMNPVVTRIYELWLRWSSHVPQQRPVMS